MVEFMKHLEANMVPKWRHAVCMIHASCMLNAATAGLSWFMNEDACPLPACPANTRTAVLEDGYLSIGSVLVWLMFRVPEKQSGDKVGMDARFTGST